jgi:hypothetical protein
MSDILRDLLLSGFMIFPRNGKFVVKKEAVPANQTVIKEKEFDSYDVAVEAAAEMLRQPQAIEWASVARYNRGLGIEYRNLPLVRAASVEEAQALSEQLAERVLGGPGVEIKEVRVRPKN